MKFLNECVFIERREKMEIWDIYNKNRVKTGKTIVRGETLAADEYHLVVHMWIINSKGQFLLQKRAAGVKSAPNMWAITGGAAIAGDDSYKACEREISEELGIKADMSRAEVYLTVTRHDSICDVWVIRQDFELDECTLQEEEVCEVRWATVDEINELIAMEKFHIYFYQDDLFSLLGV
jgi:8-oxo-dGTP diphosphatase